MSQQFLVFLIILFMLGFFIDGRFRYDFISLGGLLLLTTLNIIPIEKAFLGFSHPAVITVANVLIISQALMKLGVMDKVTVFLNKGSKSIVLKLLMLMSITALLSGFMNNIGALAIILPIAINVAKENDISASKLLMPVSFASLLGGMLTSIGTPPNLIVSMYRESAGYGGFDFFDFTPTGFILVCVGILFTILFGWRLIPGRESKKYGEIFKTEGYISEIIVPENFDYKNNTIKGIFKKTDIEVLSIIRDKNKIVAPSGDDLILQGDLLIVKGNSDDLKNIIDKTNFILKGAKIDDKDSKTYLKSEKIGLLEVVLRSDSLLINRSSEEIRLRNRFNVNLVAISRKGISSFESLKSVRFEPGDILFIQAPIHQLEEIYLKLGCVPLSEDKFVVEGEKTIFKKRSAIFIFITAILFTSFNLIPIHLAFSITSLLFVILGIITARELYNSIEWPTLIMLASLLPLGDALQTSGASDTIANILINISSRLPVWGILALLMLMTMLLTNLIGNSATTALMAPIAISIANSMKINVDPLLISVSIAAASAFLTPIGHQSNMLVMGPGGYKFTDYWRLGLPLSLLILLVGVPSILYFWPF